MPVSYTHLDVYKRQIIVGSLCSLIIVQLSWYVSLIPTGLVYYFLMKTMKSSAPFRTGTVFEK